MGKRLAGMVLVATVSLGGGLADATVPGSNGRIAFVSDRDSNFEIYAMGADGSAPTRLTSTGGDERNPAWSPEGHRIAYDVASYVHVMAVDGSYDVPIQNCYYDSDPAWSPDGARHVVHRGFGKTPFILTRDPGGQNEVDLYPAGAPAEPDWSPDGDEIVFVNERYVDGRPVSSLWLIGADGSNPRALTLKENVDSMPSWHPNSSTIAFASERDGNLEIYAMDRDGTGTTRLTEHPASDMDPVWSPDGSKIAFVSDRDGEPEIFVMDADGSDVVQLTDNDAREADPSWQPVPTTEEVPAPPQGPGTDCEQRVERDVTLELNGHLTATGTIESSGDGSGRCGVDISIQRRRRGAWRKVSVPTFATADRYRSSPPDRRGRYRAVLARSQRQYYTDRFRHICSRAVSETVVHRH